MTTDLPLCDFYLESYLESSSMGIQFIQSIFPRTDIQNDDKLLWVYLVTRCIQNRSTHCVISYQELADKMEWTLDAIHLCLQRLKLWGFLSSNNPFSRGALTVSEANQRRTLSPSLPEEKLNTQPKSININLLNYRVKINAMPITEDRTHCLNKNQVI